MALSDSALLLVGGMVLVVLAATALALTYILRHKHQWVLAGAKASSENGVKIYENSYLECASCGAQRMPGTFTPTHETMVLGEENSWDLLKWVESSPLRQKRARREWAGEERLAKAEKVRSAGIGACGKLVEEHPSVSYCVRMSHHEGGCSSSD